MDGNPPPEGRGDAAESTSSGPGRSPEEHFGPLALRRMTKPDGRSLIAYRRVDLAAPGAAGERGRSGA